MRNRLINAIQFIKTRSDDKKVHKKITNIKVRQFCYYSDNCYATTLMKNLRERSSTVKDAAEKSNTFYNISTQQ